MINLLVNIAMIASGTAMYWAGEIYKKELKYAMGIPIGLLACITHGWIVMLLCFLTYFIACEFGYGDNNPLTKLLGKRGAITFCGAALGLASFPIIGYLAILAMIVSGFNFYYISIWDDAGKIKEPWIAILRGLGGTIFLLFG